MVAGIIKASKLWTFEKAHVLHEWLKPLLIANFETMKNEYEGLWAQAIVSICYDSEPRQHSWFTDALMELWKKPSDNAYHSSV